MYSQHCNKQTVLPIGHYLLNYFNCSSSWFFLILHKFSIMSMVTIVIYIIRLAIDNVRAVLGMEEAVWPWRLWLAHSCGGTLVTSPALHPAAILFINWINQLLIRTIIPCRHTDQVYNVVGPGRGWILRAGVTVTATLALGLLIR